MWAAKLTFKEKKRSEIKEKSKRTQIGLEQRYKCDKVNMDIKKQK